MSARGFFPGPMDTTSAKSVCYGTTIVVVPVLAGIVYPWPFKIREITDQG